MRITNNMVSNAILSQLQQLNAQQSTLQSQVSSGLAISQPSDSPAVFGQVMGLESQSRQLAQFTSNANRALNLADASYSGLSSMVKIYDRASQLGTLANGAQGASANQAYASELDQLIQQTVQVANSQLGNDYIYAGTAVGAPPFTTTTNSQGQISGVTYVGNSSQTTIPLSGTASVSPTTSGTTNSGIAGFINQMVALRDALRSGDPATLQSSATTLLQSENVLTGAVAENGAVQARIQSDQTQIQSSAAGVTKLISSEADADLPSTIVKLNQAQLAYQAALQSAASVMHMSLLNYVNLQ